MPRFSDQEVADFEDILSRRLAVFEAYHFGRRKAETDRSRRFLAVVRGEEKPTTRNEKAYLYHLQKIGKPVVHVGKRLPENLKSSPHDVYRKWDDAEANMRHWKPWHG